MTSKAQGSEIVSRPVKTWTLMWSAGKPSTVKL